MTTPIHLLDRAFRVILQEARSNNAFAARLADALGQSRIGPSAGDEVTSTGRPQRRHRRPRGVVDPIELIARGEPQLRNALGPLDLDGLKDIVAEHGMDTRKLAMKWKDRDRIIELIVAFAKDRVSKGSVFRSP